MNFVFYFWFVSWKTISLGISINLNPFHVEFHLPFGFIKIGWDKKRTSIPLNWDSVKWRGFGINY